MYANEVISVIEVEAGVVSSISTFEDDNVEEAEKCFKKIAKDIKHSLDEDDLNEAIEDGYVMNSKRSVSITWSTLIK